ncbi:LysR family transcriptional regulator [Minwuia sp.]|uniref:LysR family transcriptional regulator n=1 Tax=Minwuia sp. TaxID=2493630 RepID=UPI003A940144
MNENLDWDHLQSFRAVLREGGLSQAARARGMSQPSIGRHVDALEVRLGGALFTRSRIGMTPTALALTLAPHADAMAHAAAALKRTAASDSTAISGPIRLTAAEVMAQEVLPRILTEFADDHPDIEFELVSSNQPLDLLTREADMAVRMVRPEQQAVIARRIATSRIHLYAHRAYIEAHGMPQAMKDLQGHRLIGYDRNPMAIRMAAGLGIPVTPDTFTFRSDSETAQLAMLRAGYGIGGVQVPLAARDPDLLPVMSDRLSFDLEIWLAMHERLKTSLPMRLLMDHLASGLADYARGADAV